VTRLSTTGHGVGYRGPGASWVNRITGSLLMALLLFLPAGRYFITSEQPLAPWVLSLVLPAGFVLWLLLEFAGRPLRKRVPALLLRLNGRQADIGSVKNVRLVLDWTLLLLAGAIFPSFLLWPQFVAAVVVADLLLLAIHEMGHAIVARWVRCQVYAIEIHAFHGLTIHSWPPSRRAAIMIAWGGVAAQLAVAIPLWVWLQVGATPGISPLNAALAVLGPYSVVVAIVNLLPLPGLDGALAWQRFSRHPWRPAEILTPEGQRRRW
jgi:hypothetical protein